MKYLSFLLLLVATSINAQTPAWMCESNNISYLIYASDEWEISPVEAIIAKKTTISIAFGTVEKQEFRLEFMTHVVANFEANGETIIKIFQLGQFINCRKDPKNVQVEQYVWYDEEHGDYYIVSCLNDKIISFRTLSTGNRTGLLMECSTNNSKL